jgi:hypothetical protein
MNWVLEIDLKKILDSCNFIFKLWFVKRIQHFDPIDVILHSYNSMFPCLFTVIYWFFNVATCKKKSLYPQIVAFGGYDKNFKHLSS